MTSHVEEEADEQEAAKPGVHPQDQPNAANVKVEEEKKVEEKDKKSEIDAQILKRLKASKKLVNETKKLFATMLLSDKKYTDPSRVLHAIVDDFGNPIQIGEQKDIGEFNSTFLARIQEGLNADQILEKLQELEVQKQMSQNTLEKAELLAKSSGGVKIPSNNGDVDMLNHNSSTMD